MNTTRLIIDTNQASAIHRHEAPHEYHPVFVIPPLTWAEILNGPRDRALERVRAIAQYDVLFGMELGDIYDQLLSLTESEIQSLEPIYPAGSIAHKHLLSRFWVPTEQHWKRAEELKQQGADFAANVEARFGVYKKRHHAKKSKGESIQRVAFDDINDAMQQLFYGPEAPYRTEFVRMITEDGKRPLKAESNESFFDAVLKNPMLRRFLRLHATIVFGYADVWGDAQLNVGVSQNRNDGPDIILPIYARDGDTILTKDEKLRRALRHADQKNAVRLSTWQETNGIGKPGDD